MTPPLAGRSVLATRILDLLEHESRIQFPMPPRYSLPLLCRTLNVDDGPDLRSALAELEASRLITEDDITLTPRRHAQVLVGVDDLEATLAASSYATQMAPMLMLEIAGQYLSREVDAAAAVNATRLVTVLLVAMTRHDPHAPDLTCHIARWSARGALVDVARLLGSMVARGQTRPPHTVGEVAALIDGILGHPEESPVGV